MEVYINIKSSQMVDGKKDSMEVITFGELLKTDNSSNYVIKYREDGLYAGMKTNVELDVIGNEVVHMNRSGDLVNTITIERGKKHHCCYTTPYGSFFVGVNTEEIHSDFTTKGLALHLRYTLDINSTLLSQNEMMINVKENAHE